MFAHGTGMRKNGPEMSSTSAEKTNHGQQLALLNGVAKYPEIASRFPRLRYMGSKHRLLRWIHQVLSTLNFDTAVDAFSGSGCVGYLLKSMGKEVITNDFLRFSYTIAMAAIENSQTTLSSDDVAMLMENDPNHDDFIERTYSGIFYTPAELRFLDLLSWNVRKLDDSYKRALALAAAVRACVKRQPRGVFTIAGNLEKYDDGRRDLRLPLREHFPEQVQVYNDAVFDNDRVNRALCGDVFDLDVEADLVYMDPPYVPRADDNCYIKRYHFLEGLVTYWEGLEILEETKVKKIRKRYTPFSYRRDATDAFERMFEKFKDSLIVLSYSSNGYPNLETLVGLMHEAKGDVQVYAKEHRYHFGTHSAVARARVQEYLIVGA